MKGKNTIWENLCGKRSVLFPLVFLFLFLGPALLSFSQTTNFNPQVQAMRLRQALHYYRSLADNQQWKTFQDKSCLKASEPDNCLPDLFTNLKLTGDIPLTVLPTDSLLEQKLNEGVKRFQRRHGLVADGIVGHQTLSALNVPISRRIHQLEINLLRWQADSMRAAQPLVFVNIPDYSLYLLKATGDVLWKTKVIVGQTGQEFHTKPLESRIGYFVLNPSWNIPNSIIRREIAPLMQADPGYLQRNRMQVYRLTRKGRVQVPPGSINWHAPEQLDEKIQVVQLPGADNALGRIKFLFANPYHIYLHDTPNKNLFQHPGRAYSHGCVRVQNPEILATLLLNQNWTTPSLQPYPLLPLTQTEKMVFLPTPVAVKIAYYTSWVTDTGEIQFRTDIYGYDKTLQESL